MLYPQTSSLHEQLKLNTQAIHQSLHTHPLLRRLVEQNCTLDEYRLILQVFYDFYANAEQQLNVTPFVRFDAEAPALAWLEEDLWLINGSVPLPTAVATKGSAEGYSWYLGFLYVKQGSTLGGQVMCRTLSKSLGLSTQRGLRFFSAYGERTRQMWLYFLSYLQQVEHQVDTAAVIASACGQFQILEELLSQQLSAVHTR